MSGEVRRIGVLFSRLSGYMAACLKALKESHDVELLVYCWPTSTEAPFDAGHFNWIDQLYVKTGVTRAEIASNLASFTPDALFIVGWMDQDYLHVARTFKKKGIPVIAGSDTQWEGTVRQQVGRWVAPWYLHSAIDVLWVAGERQRQLARKLGFTGMKCWSGVYACDWDKFSSRQKSKNVGGDYAPSFLYVGRYIQRKGLDVLLQAYKSYRASVAEPWLLTCVGQGELRFMLESQKGIVDRGFIQPDQLPVLMKEASAFILPSIKEPWGVVLQEAAAAGLPLICSDVCGAAVHLLQDGYNGFLFEVNNTQHLTQCMIQMSTMAPERLQRMGDLGHELSKQFTPQRWSDTLVEGISSLRKRKQD